MAVLFVHGAGGYDDDRPLSAALEAGRLLPPGLRVELHHCATCGGASAVAAAAHRALGDARR